MKNIRRLAIICLCIALTFCCGRIVSQKDKIKQLEKTSTIVKDENIYLYSFKVRSRATAEIYTVVSARITKDDEMEVQIYNYYTNKYEWYPIYKFYKYVAIATYIDKDYAETHFKETDTDTNFIDYARYNEQEL